MVGMDNENVAYGANHSYGSAGQSPSVEEQYPQAHQGQRSPDPIEDGEGKVIFRRPLDETRHIPCVFFARGECKHGSSCRFSHDFDPSEIAKLPVEQQQLDAQQQQQYMPIEQREQAAANVPPSDSHFSPPFASPNYDGMDMYAQPFAHGRMNMPYPPGPQSAGGVPSQSAMGKGMNPMYPQMFPVGNHGDGIGMDGMPPFGVPGNAPYLYGFPEMMNQSGIQSPGHSGENLNDGIKGRNNGNNANGHVDPRYGYPAFGPNGYALHNGYNFNPRSSRSPYMSNGYANNAPYGRRDAQNPMGPNYNHMNGYAHGMDHANGSYGSSHKHGSRPARGDVPADVCVFYIQGASKCRNGDNCGFIHPVPMSSTPPIRLDDTQNSSDSDESALMNEHGLNDGDHRDAPNDTEKRDLDDGSGIRDGQDAEVVLNGIPCVDVRGRGAWKKFPRSSNHSSHHGGAMNGGRGFGTNSAYRRGWQYGQGPFEKGKGMQDEDQNLISRVDVGDLPANPTHRKDDGNLALGNGFKPSLHGPNGKRHSNGGMPIHSNINRKRVPSAPLNGVSTSAQVPAKPFNANSEVDFPALPRKATTNFLGKDHDHHFKANLGRMGRDGFGSTNQNLTAAEIAAAAAELPQPQFRSSVPHAQGETNGKDSAGTLPSADSMTADISALTIKETDGQGDIANRILDTEHSLRRSSMIESSSTTPAAVSA